MNILLIGNGFDLAHGMPTTYKDFLDFMRFVQKPTTDLCENMSQQLYSLTVNFDLENIDLDEQAANNVWLEYFFGMQSEIPDGWIDFEEEMRRIISILDMIPPTDNQKQLYNEVGKPLGLFWSTLKKCKVPHTDSIIDLCNFLEDIRNRLLSDLDQLIFCLETYLRLCMENINSNNKLGLFDECGFLEGNPIEAILSFNYTNSFEKIYQPRMKTPPEYCYVHGKIRENNQDTPNNMVLGIDEYLSLQARDSNTSFLAFKKYYQRIFKHTDFTYTDWLHESKTNLFVIGHSLSTTDRSVLRDLILHRGTKTRIYYHTREANAEHIRHLLNVIGYENLNNLARGRDEDRSIEFLSLF